MSESRSSLGGAITRLGLEDKFLANGELTRFPLVERGRIANDIIFEKLRLGTWQTVIEMIYGGLGKASALFDGDFDELRERILSSAVENFTDRNFTDRRYASISDKTMHLLSDAGEDELLFKLATSIPSLNYDEIRELIRHMSPAYFNDSVEGPQRLQDYHEVAGKKALEHGKYAQALQHLDKTGDGDASIKVFERFMSQELGYLSKEDLERIALSNPEQKEERLRRIVLNCFAVEGRNLSPMTAFELYKKNDIPLSKREKASLYAKIAEEVGGYDIRKLSEEDAELKLLWAKKHAQTDPRTAYNIFRQQGFDGHEFILAIESGLDIDNYQNSERLGAEEISEEDLMRTYETTSFSIKTKIANHLQDNERLQELSRQALGNGDLRTAYQLWINGKGVLDGEYLSTIRTSLVNSEIERDSSSFWFLNNSDLVGKVQVYDLLMQQRKDSGRVKKAYELALDLKDEERIQRAREAMVSFNHRWALQTFSGGGIEGKDIDEQGIDYVVGVVASEYGIEQETLRDFVNKYQP